MAEIIRVFKKFTNKIFGIKKSELSSVVFNSAPNTVVYKTRTQLVEEGKGRYVCRRHTHGIPTLNKLN